MNERKKGNRLEKFITDYVVLDLETTSNKIYDAKIIEIAAIKIRDGEIVECFETLVNPEIHIPLSASEINHITDDMVKDAPKLENVLEEFLAFINGEILVGHNITTFDLNVLYDAVKIYNGSDLDNDFVDTLYLARKCNNCLDNYKLQTICQCYDIDDSNNHRAMKDCYMTDECFRALKNEYDQHGFVCGSKKHSASTKHCTKYTDETKALQTLQGFLMGIIADDKLTVDEIVALDTWMENNIELRGNYPFDRVFESLERVLEDGVIEPRELDELLVLFKKYVNPAEDTDEICINTIVGKSCCLTGTFAYGDKKEVEQLIIEKGGVCDNSVKKSTNYVVVGALGSDSWKQGNYGGKIKKAMELKEKGCEVQVITEEKFFNELEKAYIPKNVVDITFDEDEQLMMFAEITNESESWKIKIQDVLDQLVEELELPEKSLYLAQNIGRVSNTITSYSVCVYEPEYPKVPDRKMDQTRNSVVMNIKDKKNRLEIIVGNTQYKNVNYDGLLETKNVKSDPKNIHIFIDKDSNELTDIVKLHTEYRIKHYESKASMFGCCSKFNECSDAKKCVHENKLYSMACSYRRNLDAGRIFYGKNRNID